MSKDKSLSKTDSYICGKWVEGKKVANVSEIDRKTAAKTTVFSIHDLILTTPTLF